MLTVGALATLVNGAVVGDASREISSVADLASAGPRDITFLANPKYAALVASTRAGALIVIKALEQAPCPQIVAANPYLAMAAIAQTLFPAPKYAAGVDAKASVHPEARVDATAVIRAGAVVDKNATIGPRTIVDAQAFVGAGASVGADCHLHPGAKVLHRCTLGDRVILQANAVIGSDGFGYAPDASGKRHKIPQVGIVAIEDDVEIGASTTIDRATFGTTRIGRGSKIDNLVQIAHNVTIGQDCVIVSQSGIAGSSSLGDRVVMGAQVGVVGHIAIASDVQLAARSGVSGKLAAGVYGGAPTQSYKKWVKSTAALALLPELRKRVRELERRVLGMSSAEDVDGSSSDSGRQ